MNYIRCRKILLNHIRLQGQLDTFCYRILSKKVVGAVSQTIRGKNITSEVQLPLNSMRSLLLDPFKRSTTEKKSMLPITPDLKMTQQTKEKNKAWSFCRSWFERLSWPTVRGIEIEFSTVNPLHSRNILVFQVKDNSWVKKMQLDFL